ncbi:MAG: hypothetical protein WCK15_03225 [Pirellula sp.]
MVRPRYETLRLMILDQSVLYELCAIQRPNLHDYYTSIDILDDPTF